VTYTLTTGAHNLDVYEPRRWDPAVTWDMDLPDATGLVRKVRVPAGTSPMGALAITINNGASYPLKVDVRQWWDAFKWKWPLAGLLAIGLVIVLVLRPAASPAKARAQVNTFQTENGPVIVTWVPVEAASPTGAVVDKFAELLRADPDADLTKYASWLDVRVLDVQRLPLTRVKEVLRPTPVKSDEEKIRDYFHRTINQHSVFAEEMEKVRRYIADHPQDFDTDVKQKAFLGLFHDEWNRRSTRNQ
jgi:hypothetical protein